MLEAPKPLTPDAQTPEAPWEGSRRHGLCQAGPGCRSHEGFHFPSHQVTCLGPGWRFSSRHTEYFAA